MYCKDQPQSIQTMFNHIAKRYDLTNAVLSFSLHKYWNRRLVHQILCQRPSHTLVDLCSGTGDIALDYLQKSTVPCQAYLIDFSSEMLSYARQKAEKLPSCKHSLHYIEADVQTIPLKENLADCATMAYGIRNVQKPAQCLADVFRILKPGGRFGILELTRPQNAFLRMGHKIYLKTFLPLLGKWLTTDKQAYEYLCQSIDTFIAPTTIEALLQQQGFVNTRRIALCGGIATIILGEKPNFQ